jgi:hypothetical protein
MPAKRCLYRLAFTFFDVSSISFFDIFSSSAARFLCLKFILKGSLDGFILPSDDNQKHDPKLTLHHKENFWLTVKTTTDKTDLNPPRQHRIHRSPPDERPNTSKSYRQRKPPQPPMKREKQTEKKKPTTVSRAYGKTS